MVSAGNGTGKSAGPAVAVTPEDTPKIATINLLILMSLGLSSQSNCEFSCG
jgi:hypothetical protein